MQIIAHRGSKGTHPENTLSAFREAVRVNAAGIELDVHLSKDNHLMVIHDETIDRTTDGTGYIKDKMLSELKAVNAAAKFKEDSEFNEIPTLEEVLNLLEELQFLGILNIEIKTDTYEYQGIEQRLVELINKKKHSFPIVYSSFNLNTLTRIHEIDDAHLKYWIMEGTAEEVKKANELSYIDGIHPSIDFLQQDSHSWQEFNKIIRPWTVNQESQFQFCIAHQLTGFHTDFPEKAQTYLNQLQSSN